MSSTEGGLNPDNDKIINYNQPPSTQPGLWCQWIPTEDNMGIEWDGTEKFYHYVEWLQYLIDKVLAPKGYVVNGKVNYQGEDTDDKGIVTVYNNSAIALSEEVLKVIGNNNPIEFLQDKKNLPPLMGIEEKLDIWIEKKLKN